MLWLAQPDFEYRPRSLLVEFAKDQAGSVCLETLTVRGAGP